MIRKLLFTAILFSLVLALSAQNQIKFEEYTLDNGMHVILHQDKTTPIVAVTVLYHVGSKNEDPSRTGFAHFFEHLLFEGTENIARGEFDTYVVSAGGTLNANTSQDRTFYYEILPSNELALGLWLESERLRHAKILQEGVDTQREVVKEEKRQRVDNQPYASFSTEMFKRAYTVHPYNWVPIGSMDHLNAATLEEFMDFYKKFYIPNNATLSIAGDIDIAQAKELIQFYFGDIPRGNDVKQPTIVEPPLKSEIRDVVYDNIQLPAAFIGYRIPGESDPDSYTLEMITRVLSRGGSSRLNQRLVEKDKSALQVFAFPFGLEQGGLFINLAIASAGFSPEDLEKAMDEEVERLQKELITEEEFKKIQNQVENDFVSSNSSMAGIAEQLANYHVYYGDANLINTEIERYRKVTREDIMNAAKKYLRKDNRVVLYYLPKDQEKN
jgi:predicted Zn-dependent peptidase